MAPVSASFHLRSLDCWTWFGSLLFGQLTGHDSIRAIERIFATSDSKMRKLGLGPVRRSTLADANRTRGHICDQVIYLKSQTGSGYEGKLRRITYRDPVTGKRLTFLTNRFDLATQTICDLYKARWKVELFFKTMKQYLRVKKFLGTSSNAVKAQILVALIAYLLVQILRFSFKTSISIANAMAVVGTLLLLNEPLSRLLGDLPRVTRHPPDPQMEFIL